MKRAHAQTNRPAQFYGFLEAQGGTPATLRDELENLGIDVARVELAVNGIVSRSRSRARETWLERARKSQAEFTARVQQKKAWVSQQFGDGREILAAISSGRLGMGVQQQAHVFFRNRDLDQATESDLRSFLDDCELLGLVDRKASGQKDGD